MLVILKKVGGGDEEGKKKRYNFIAKYQMTQSTMNVTDTEANHTHTHHITVVKRYI